MWVAVVDQRLAIPTDPEIPLWVVWPDALPSLLFITAFLMMCRDLWTSERVQHLPILKVSWSSGAIDAAA
jgi:hypothetical protein